MRRKFPLLLLIAAIVIGVGFYRNWFVLSTERDDGSHKIDINLTVDPDQMKEDAKQVSP